MAHGKDAVEPLPAFVFLYPMHQYGFRRRHDAPTMGESMQVLKALVVFMGVLIVVGMGILAYGISVKFGQKTEQEAVSSTPSRTPAAAPWPGDIEVTIPAGAQVAETIAAEGRMIVRLALPDGRQRFVVVDLVGGRQLGAVELAPQGGAK